MSLTPRNIVVNGPYFLRDIQFATGGDPSGLEASPIYTSISGTCDINGSYYGTGFLSDIEYIYSSVTLTPDSLTTRRSLRSLSPFHDYSSDSIITDEIWNVDVGATGDLVGANEFVAVHGYQVSRTPSPFDIPIFSERLTKENLTAGTRRDHSTSPATDSDIGASIEIVPPAVTGSIEGGDLKLVFSIIVGMNLGAENYTETLQLEIDASAWTSTDFRDIRGTYGATSYDSKGIEYIWSLTIA